MVENLKGNRAKACERARDEDEAGVRFQQGCQERKNIVTNTSTRGAAAKEGRQLHLVAANRSPGRRLHTPSIGGIDDVSSAAERVLVCEPKAAVIRCRIHRSI